MAQLNCLLWVSPRKMLFDFFERLAFGFGKEKSCDDEINYRAASEHEKHCAVAVFADGWQEDGSDCRGDGLIDE
jgi:hypothetical protein